MKIAALICTVLACMGGIVLLTDSSPIQECLPPTILLAVAAAICWVLFCKKNRQKSAAQTGPENKRKPIQTEDWKHEELWADYPFPDYDKYHTYCSVEIDATGKIFYYRTRNPELKVGDRVYVPVGRAYEKKIGRIVRMENVRGEEIPYPLGKTKFISGKV